MRVSVVRVMAILTVTREFEVICDPDTSLEHALWRQRREFEKDPDQFLAGASLSQVEFSMVPVQ